MLPCPRCHVPLVRCQNEYGNFWHCGDCEGTAVTISLLRKFVSRETLNKLWQDAKQRENPRKCACPGCNEWMEEIPVDTPSGMHQIDVCSHCQFIWMDAGEWDSLPHIKVEKKEPELSPAAREEIAIHKIEKMEREYDERYSDGTPEEWWQWIPALLGMPIEEAEPLQKRRPWMTWGITALVLACSLLAFTSLEEVVRSFGLIPAEAGRLGGATFITSFFLHGGIMHLLGNLYFLWIFGDNVEDCLGWLKYLLLIIGATIVGDICHIMIDPSSTVPCIGASGGISGVIAFYALRYPNTRLSLMFIVFFRPVFIRLNAIWMFALWILLQGYVAIQQAYGFGHVSGGAHLGGALAGFVLWLSWKMAGSKDPELEEI